MKNTPQIFPKPTDKGETWIDGDKIFYKEYERNILTVVKADQLQYAYLLVNKNQESFLFLFDHHQHLIATNYQNFKQVYTLLSERFGFDDEVFFKHVNQVEVFKQRIWINNEAPTFEVLAHGGKEDYNLGFEIQSPTKEFIFWDTTYEELQDNSFTYLTISPYQQNILKFYYPVRIGHVILKDLTAYFDNRRKDIAVQHYYTHCSNILHSDDSYEELKQVLKQGFSEENQHLQYERADQKSFTFDAQGVELSLVYTYDSSWQYDDGSTSVNIRNNRAYPELLIDIEYQSKCEFTESILLNNEVDFSGNYKQNHRVKQRFEGMLNEAIPFVWIDKKNEKIGFAGKEKYQLFSFEEIESFTLQNITPARGRGHVSLIVNHPELKKTSSVFRGKCYALDQFKKQIEDLVQKKIHVAPEFPDF